MRLARLRDRGSVFKLYRRSTRDLGETANGPAEASRSRAVR